MATYEERARREMEAAQQEDINGAFSIAYPRSEGLRSFARDSKKLKQLGLKGQRPKAAQRKKKP